MLPSLPVYMQMANPSGRPDGEVTGIRGQKQAVGKLLYSIGTERRRGPSPEQVAISTVADPAFPPFC